MIRPRNAAQDLGATAAPAEKRRKSFLLRFVSDEAQMADLCEISPWRAQIGLFTASLGGLAFQEWRQLQVTEVPVLPIARKQSTNSDISP